MPGAGWQRSCAASQVPGCTVLLPRGPEAATGRLQAAAGRHLVPERSGHPARQISEHSTLSLMKHNVTFCAMHTITRKECMPNIEQQQLGPVPKVACTQYSSTICITCSIVIVTSGITSHAVPFSVRSCWPKTMMLDFWFMSCCLVKQGAMDEVMADIRCWIFYPLLDDVEDKIF